MRSLTASSLLTLLLLAQGPATAAKAPPAPATLGQGGPSAEAAEGALPANRAAPAADAPRVDMVFVLDTTGSMGGLIDGAKRKIWGIVNAVMQGTPVPEVRVGLVAYRDRNDAYVTRVTGLSNDLDAVYADLMALTAGGGGDGPEDVNRALHDALHRIEWSEGRAPGLRVVFLVGDAPPHVDYADVPAYGDTVRAAAQKGILVNAIRCGGWAETGTHFSEIARLGGGDFLTIDASGGMVVPTTPYDADMARLSRALDDTFVAGGRAEARRAAEASLDEAEEVAEAGGAFARAERAAFRAKSAAAPAAAARADLVAAFEADPAAAAERLAKTEELPEVLRDLEPEARRAYVAEKAAERTRIRAELERLAAERGRWLAAHATEGADGFDAHVVELVRRQAAKRAGIRY